MYRYVYRSNLLDYILLIFNMLYIINGGERGIIPGILPSTPSGPHFVRSNLLPANLYSGHPALRPWGSLRSCKFAPGKFVEPKGSHQILTIPIFLGMAFAIPKNMAESEGFEPSIRFPVYTLSRGAPSATRPALLNSNCYPVTSFMLASTWRTCALLRASCPSPFGPSAQNADVQNRSRRFCQPLGQLS